MRSLLPLSVVAALLAPPAARAQIEPPPERPAPAAEVPPAEPPPAEAPAPAATPAAAPAAPPVSADAPAAFQRECWRVDAPIEDAVPMMPDSEMEAHVTQAGFGALTRRAVFNAEGADARITDTTKRQEDLLVTLRWKKGRSPMVAGGLGLLGGVALALVGVSAAGAWAASYFVDVPMLNAATRTNQYVSYGVLVAAVVALPVGLLVAAAALIPAGVGAFMTQRARRLSDSPLLDETGFSANEAHEMVEAHNLHVSRRLGLAAVPACTGR